MKPDSEGGKALDTRVVFWKSIAKPIFKPSCTICSSDFWRVVTSKAATQPIDQALVSSQAVSCSDDGMLLSPVPICYLHICSKTRTHGSDSLGILKLVKPGAL